MKVSGIMHADPATCRTSESCERAARIMRDRDVGFLPVLDEHGRIAGVVTDRDLCMSALDRGEPLAAIPVTAAMSSPVHTCRSDESIDLAEALMSSHRVRRLPVLDGAGLTVGVVSLDDLAREYASHRLSSLEVASTFAGVASHEP